MKRAFSKSFVKNCIELRDAYKSGLLGNMKMPEDAQPSFDDGEVEQRLVYFTLPMSLNYQRNSYALWEAATRCFLDPETADVFSVKHSAKMPSATLRSKLLKYKVALQPNKHVDTWQRLAQTFNENWGSVLGFAKACEFDFCKMRQIVQKDLKKNFPYLSGPKIFNYWSFILIEYGGLNLLNRDQIEIAPDTHVIQASIKLGVLTVGEAEKIHRDEISNRWRTLLKESEISPIDMHSPLWFWSRNSFAYELGRS